MNRRPPLPDTKKKIIDTATYLLQTRGYLWSYEDISKALGVKKASIHYHFPTKEHLIAECTHLYIEAGVEKMESIAMGSAANLEKMKQLIEIYRQAYETKNAICLCTMLSAYCNNSSAETNSQLKNFFEYTLQWLIAVLTAGIREKEFSTSLSPALAASVVLNSLQGLLLTQRLAAASSAEFKAKALHILDILL